MNLIAMLGLAWVRWAVVAAVAGGLVASFAYSNQRKGAVKAVAKIEKANDNASKIGKGAASKSLSDGVRGQRDPTTRND